MGLFFYPPSTVLEQVLAWLPEGAEVLLSADRFYPSSALFAWLHARRWGYRLRLKGNPKERGHERTGSGLARKNGVRSCLLHKSVNARPDPNLFDPNLFMTPIF